MRINNGSIFFGIVVVAATLALLLGFADTLRSAFQQDARPQWLLFTKSAGFEHDTIKQPGGAPSYLFKQLEPLFAARGIRLIESKDGRLFEPTAIKRYSGFVFYTTDDLTKEGTDKQPPMTLAGKQALLDAVAGGVPFIGLHCASDTFDRSAGEAPDDFTKMLGGEFDSHGDQQKATARVVDPNFPGVGEQSQWTDVDEEWYALANLSEDLRAIHLMETAGMQGKMYEREPYPITWTHEHGNGRVFYTALGHREDVIASKAFQELVGGAIDWCRAK